MIDALLARLEREAEAEITRVAAEGHAAAAAITASAADALARRQEEALAQREESRREAVERAVATTRHAARQRVLAARAQFLIRVFAQLEKALPGIAATPAYRSALSRDLARARAFLGGQPGAIRRAPTGGLRLVTADGRLEVDVTLAGRMERLRPRLALEALAALGGGLPA
jgi:vacuolar-type H+-ATPase subunit E/Vma4